MSKPVAVSSLVMSVTKAGLSSTPLVCTAHTSTIPTSSRTVYTVRSKPMVTSVLVKEKRGKKGARFLVVKPEVLYC